MNKLKIIELNETNTCKICDNKLGNYTCPKCNILYCSVNCYKSDKHIQCSENFYRDCVMEEIKSEGSSAESQQKMVEILKRFNEQYGTENEIGEMDSDDDDECPDLADRFENIDLNDAKTVWNLLTQDEQQEFEALVSSNDITKLLPEWKPWWEFKNDTKLVQELENVSTVDDYKKNCPNILENIPKFDQICARKPAEAVKYNLLNIIAAYTCIVRYYNGDHFEFCKEAVYLITNLSKNLECNASFESFSLAMESVYQQALINEWITVDADTKIQMYQDVENITAGPEKSNKKYYIKSALSDLYNLLKLSKKEKQKPIDNDNPFFKRFQDNVIPTEKIIPKQKVTLYMKKIEYYLSYITTFDCIFQ